MSYVLPEEVRIVATGMSDSAKTSGNPAGLDDDQLDILIEQASRIFDLHCGVEPEHFEARADGVATARVIYGNGSNYLKLPPHVTGTVSATISVPTGYTVQEFIQADGYLVRAETGTLANSLNWTVSGWYSGLPITVTAKWGYETTPADVKAAIIELVINIWRETDPAFLKLVNLDSQPIREKMPPRVTEIAKRYRVKQGVFV